MDAEIGILPRRLAATAVGVLALAFDQDPILTHYLGQGRRRAVAYRMFFAGAVQSTLPFGHVYAATAGNRLLGVAAWKPPDPPASSLRNMTTSALRERVVRALYPRAAQQLFASSRSIHRSRIGTSCSSASSQASRARDWGRGFSRRLFNWLMRGESSVTWRRRFVERTSSISAWDSTSPRSPIRLLAHHPCGR
jgi:hypothetical protein